MEVTTEKRRASAGAPHQHGTPTTKPGNKSFILRNVPATIHREWKVLAAKQGVSMEDLLLRHLISLLRSKQTA